MSTKVLVTFTRSQIEEINKYINDTLEVFPVILNAEVTILNEDGNLSCYFTYYSEIESIKLGKN